MWSLSSTLIASTGLISINLVTPVSNSDKQSLALSFGGQNSPTVNVATTAEWSGEIATAVAKTLTTS